MHQLFSMLQTVFEYVNNVVDVVKKFSFVLQGSSIPFKI